MSPYKMLPPLFADWDEEQLDATVSGMDNIADGGAALLPLTANYSTPICRRKSGWRLSSRC
jgi:hypothetical protein